jgi:hypothetical protein
MSQAVRDAFGSISGLPAMRACLREHHDEMWR